MPTFLGMLPQTVWCLSRHQLLDRFLHFEKQKCLSEMPFILAIWSRETQNDTPLAFLLLCSQEGQGEREKSKVWTNQRGLLCHRGTHGWYTFRADTIFMTERSPPEMLQNQHHSTKDLGPNRASHHRSSELVCWKLWFHEVSQCWPGENKFESYWLSSNNLHAGDRFWVLLGYCGPKKGGFR